MTPKIYFFISGAIAVFFIVFSYIVSTGTFQTIDLTTTIILQKNIPRAFDAPFSFLSLLGSFEVTTIAFVAGVAYLFKRSHNLSLPIISLYVFGTLLEIFGKRFLLHPSPPPTYFRYVGLIFPSGYVHTDYSYPSGHIFRITFIAVFLLTALNFKDKRAHAVVSILIFRALMMISRIYLGEHWLTDVIGGTLLGTSLGLLTYFFLKTKKYTKSK